MSSIILFMMVFSFVVPLSVLGGSLRLGILVFIGFVILFSIVGYRYRWCLYESISLEDLPADLWIIHAPGKNIRLVIIAIFLVVLLVYGGILIINLIRQ